MLNKKTIGQRRDSQNPPLPYSLSGLGEMSADSFQRLYGKDVKKDIKEAKQERQFGPLSLYLHKHIHRLQENGEELTSDRTNLEMISGAKVQLSQLQEKNRPPILVTMNKEKKKVINKRLQDC